MKYTVRSFKKFRPRLENLEGRLLPTTYTVINTDNSGAGSLRRAIQDANGHNGADLIVFNIPGAGVHTIAPTSVLPDITDPVTIDGYTQPGASANTQATGNNAVLLIELSGANVGNFENVLWLRNVDDCVIRGLVINRAAGNGIHITSGSGHKIEGNFIGTNSAGTSSLGNFYNGVSVVDSTAVTVGGATPAARNVLSGNGAHGVYLFDGTSQSVVQGNYIGTNKSGAAAIQNGLGGVVIENNSTFNTIGGTAAAARNVISGNTVGISIFSAGVANNNVQGNYIGADATGLVAVGNGTGMFIATGADNNTVGGTGVGAGNLISGNVGVGIWISEPGTTGNVVQGNYIGTNALGTSALGNGGPGVKISLGATANVIGGTTAGARNVISSNGLAGVFIEDAATAANQVLGNYLGVDVTGTVMLGNTVDGVRIIAGNNNIVGGTAAGAGNVIAYSGGDGVVVDTGDGNAIRHSATRPAPI